MSSVQEIFRITERLITILEKPVPQENREDVIDEISFLLEEREKFLKELKKPNNEHEKQIGKQVIKWNIIINEKLDQIKSQVQKDIMNLKKTKATNKHYVNPYKDVTISDGMFYDKRN